MTTYEITFDERTAVGKNILMFLEQNKKHIKVVDSTEISDKEELVAIIEQAHKDQKEGKCIRLKYEEIDDFMESL
jgi:hypothetical protein